jgi:glycosyltransferase involved in cell wall biosynthesis
VGESVISVVIPCFNAQEYLEQTIKSVLSQTRPADELIVVDDCSTDDSVRIAERYKAVTLSTAVNSGHATARNLGVARAQGDIIAWVDADDYWEPNHLQVVCGLLDRFPEAAIAFSRVRMLGAREGIYGRSPCDERPGRLFRESFERTVVPAMSAVTRKNALLRVGGYSETIRYAPDFDLWLRMSRVFLFVSSPLVTSNYRWHESQISATHAHNQWRSMYASRIAMIERLRADGEAEVAGELESQLMQLWEDDLSRSWHRRQMDDLRLYASLSPLLPRQTPATRRYCRFAELPRWLMGAADRVPPKVKRTLARELEGMARACGLFGNDS